MPLHPAPTDGTDLWPPGGTEQRASVSDFIEAVNYELPDIELRADVAYVAGLAQRLADIGAEAEPVHVEIALTVPAEIRKALARIGTGNAWRSLSLDALALARVDDVRDLPRPRPRRWLGRRRR